MNEIWMPIGERVLTMTVIAALFLLFNRIFGKKFSSGGRCIAGIILVIGFLIPLRLPIFKIELPEERAAKWDSVTEGPHWSWSIPEYTPVRQPSSDEQSPIVPPSNPSTAHPTLSPLALLLALYLAGFAASLFRTFYRYGRSVKAIRRCGRAPSEKEMLVFSVLIRSYGIASPPHLLVCSDLRSPLMFGVTQQTVVIPAGLAEEELALILGHELIHCKRRDSLTKFLLAFANAVYWFHPLMLCLTRTLCDLCEEACDEALLAGKSLDTKRQYSRMLVLAAVGKDTSTEFLLTTFKGGSHQMKKHLNNILSDKKKKSGAIILALALLVTVLSVSVYATAQSNPPSIAEEERLHTIIENHLEKQNGEKPSAELVNSLYELTPEGKLQKIAGDILDKYEYISDYQSEVRTCPAYGGQPIIYWEVCYYVTDGAGNTHLQRSYAQHNYESSLQENGIAVRFTAEQGVPYGCIDGHFTLDVIEFPDTIS